MLQCLPIGALAPEDHIKEVQNPSRHPDVLIIYSTCLGVMLVKTDLANVVQKDSQNAIYI